MRDNNKRALKEEIQKEIDLSQDEVMRNHRKRHHKSCKEIELRAKYLMDSMSSNKVEHLPIKVDSQKGQERAEKCISIVNAKVYKAMQTWAKMAKDANAQAEHVDKDIKAIIP